MPASPQVSEPVRSAPEARALRCWSASARRVTDLSPGMNATRSPSGENATALAPFVPGTSRASPRSSRRTNSRRTPSFTPIIATARPSGEIAIDPAETAWGSVSGG